MSAQVRHLALTKTMCGLSVEKTSSTRCAAAPPRSTPEGTVLASTVQVSESLKSLSRAIACSQASNRPSYNKEATGLTVAQSGCYKAGHVVEPQHVPQAHKLKARDMIEQ
jgi:hypothetical protein